MLRACLLFVVAGLSEIGGGYLVWQWLRNDKPIWLGLGGGIILFLYGVVATFQVFSFGKAYAAYGGAFIVMALLWGWWVGNTTPDLNEWIGAVICLVGVSVMLLKR
ncbi:hypothetical protein SD51_13355 [Alicyclobacillus tengchongensis]|nr:hypothetical protein SD51_13355 [Alicyclobacillus tengchongensis]